MGNTARKGSSEHTPDIILCVVGNGAKVPEGECMSEFEFIEG